MKPTLIARWRALPSLLKAIVIAIPIWAGAQLLKTLGVIQESPPQAQATNAPIEVRPAATQVTITMQEYKKLQTGMPYNQVMAILGSEGTEISSNDIGGHHTVMYQWKAGALANMNAMFQDDKLVSKAQFGLQP